MVDVPYSNIYLNRTLILELHMVKWASKNKHQEEHVFKRKCNYIVKICQSF